MMEPLEHPGWSDADPGFDLETLVLAMKRSGVPTHRGRETASENGNTKASGPEK